MEGGTFATPEKLRGSPISHDASVARRNRREERFTSRSGITGASSVRHACCRHAHLTQRRVSVTRCFVADLPQCRFTMAARRVFVCPAGASRNSFSGRETVTRRLKRGAEIPRQELDSR